MRRHFFFLGIFVVAVLLVAGVFALWQEGAINIPPLLLHSLRYLNAGLFFAPDASLQLDIPFFRQEHALSCEAASVRTALAALGVSVTEDEILRVMPFDPTPRRSGAWGDPNKGFVGNIDGKMLVDGYGIHWDPIAVMIADHWAGAEVIRNGSPETLAAHLLQGHPVIVWGYLGRGFPATWKTPEGNAVSAVNGEHTRVVYGFAGPPENPRGFFLVDPIYGHRYWKRDAFLRNWDALGGSGVVIFPR